MTESIRRQNESCALLILIIIILCLSPRVLSADIDFQDSKGRHAMSYMDLEMHAVQLEGHQQYIANTLIAASKEASDLDSLRTMRDELFSLFDWHKSSTIADTFILESDVYKIVSVLVGEDEAATMRRMWERATFVPFNVKRSPSSLRSKNYDSLYIFNNIALLLNYMAGLADGFTLSGYMSERRSLSERIGLYNEYKDSSKPYHMYRLEIESSARQYNGQQIFLPCLLGMLSENEPGFVEKLRELLVLEAKRGKITRELVSGLLQDTVHDNIYLLFYLYLYPYPDMMLEERWMIIEEIDRASAKVFYVFYRLFTEHPFLSDLASEIPLYGIERWTGLKLCPNLKNEQLANILDMAWLCLSNYHYYGGRSLEQYINSDCEVAVYFALWAVGIRELQDSIDIIKGFAKDGHPAQIKAAVFFLSQLPDNALREEAVNGLQPVINDEADGDVAHIVNTVDKGEQIRLTIESTAHGNKSRLRIKISDSQDNKVSGFESRDGFIIQMWDQARQMVAPSW